LIIILDLLFIVIFIVKLYMSLNKNEL